MTCQATFLHDQFFFFIQSEFGDLYKVTLQFTDQLVHSMQVQFFDTVAPGTSINILKTGYLFVGAESSNHSMYLFKSTGDDEESPVVCISQQSEEFEKDPSLIPLFNPREPANLELRDEMQNYAPINDMKVDDLTNEGLAQIYLACGRGAQGTIRALRHGLSIVEMAVSPMPGRPNSV
jgi:splicing factor 3B subunit 3